MRPPEKKNKYIFFLKEKKKIDIRSHLIISNQSDKTKPLNIWFNPTLAKKSGLTDFCDQHSFSWEEDFSDIM